MPVDSKHKLYEKRSKEWRLCRTVIDGEEAVKSAGEAFLPRLSEQTPQEYEAYKTRAVFYAATARTVEAVLGMIFREEPKVEFPESKVPLLHDVTPDHRSLLTFSKEVTGEVIGLGRFGVLVDADTSGTKPYLAGYTAESIINWRAGRTPDGQERLELVVLLEDVPDPDTSDMFSSSLVPQIRVLALDDSGGYVVMLFHRKRRPDQQATGGAINPREEWVLVETITPVIRGQRLGEIPFVFIGSRDLQSTPEKSPVLDLASINISHYRSSADLEHGRHFTALPTPWAAGFNSTSKLTIGSAYAWVTEEPTASCGYLEFSGQGLAALEKALQEKEAQMAVLGSRLLAPDKAAVEAADTLRMRRSSESSIVSSVVMTVSEGLTKALNWFAFWAGLFEEVKLELNDEFYDEVPDMATIAQLMTGVQLGLVSWTTLYHNLNKANLYPEGHTAEAERAAILIGLPQIVLPPEDETELEE